MTKIARNNADQLKKELIPVLEFFNNPSTGSFAADVAILLGKLGDFAKSFGDTSFMNTYHKLSFAYYDKDGNGTIDREEFKIIMDDIDKLTNTVMNKSADEVFDEMDRNGDGVIDFSEYLQLVNTNDDITKNRKKTVWRQSQELTNSDVGDGGQQGSDFMSSLDSILEFLGVQKSASIISDLANLNQFVQSKEPKVLAEQVRSKMLDTLTEFYSGDDNLVDDSKFALITIDYADVTGIEDIPGFVEECASRKKQTGTDLTKEEAKKVILTVASL